MSTRRRQAGAVLKDFVWRASHVDPLERRVRTLALAPSELVGLRRFFPYLSLPLWVFCRG
jgi:hypothetical protein